MVVPIKQGYYARLYEARTSAELEGRLIGFSALVPGHGRALGGAYFEKLPERTYTAVSDAMLEAGIPIVKKITRV